MKRHLLFSGLFVGSLLLAGGLRAQDAVTAAAEREQAEERYRTTNTRITQLEEALQSFQKRLSNLREENGKLRDEIDRLKNKGESTATQESLKHLAEKIEEVDKKRLSDSENTAKAFEKLQKLLRERPSHTPSNEPGTTGRPGPDPVKPGPEARPPGGREVGWEYAIQNNDTLSGIVAKLRTRDDFKKLTQLQLQKQIMGANPGVNWNKLKINQKLFIPAPP
jgi:hypothetical protein